MAKKDLLATINETAAVGGGATGVSKVADPVGGTATLPNSKKQGDAMQKVEDPSNTAIETTDGENNTKPTGDKAASNKASIATKPSAASSVKEDVAAMLDGFELSEDFKVQASTLFEAAVASRISEERVALEEEFQAKETELQESFEQAKAELIEEVSDKVDDYLSYVVKEWMEANQVAIEQSLRTELTEDLIGNIKRVFEESHINLPDEQVSVVEQLAAQVEELEDKLNSVLDENITLTSALEESARKEIFDQVSEGLAMTQVDKFRSLAEGVDFSDADTYASKLQLVKEQYFGDKKSAAPTQLIEEREMVELTEEVAPAKPAGAVANYVTAISRTVKK